MKNFVSLIALLVFLPGCGAEAASSSKPPAQQEQEGSSQTIVELTIVGMTSESDAKDVRKDLEWVSGVERVIVDHANGKAKVLMKKGVRPSDIADKVQDLFQAVDEPCSVMGFRYHSDESRTIKLKW